MIITDFNEMGIDVLMALHEGINMEFEINDGKIIKATEGRRTKNAQN